RESSLDLQDLDHVDRGKATADHDGAGMEFVARALVVALRIVVEPVDEGVLIDEAPVDELVGAFDGKRTVTPRSVGQDYCVKAPLCPEIVELEVAAQPCQRDVGDIGMVEAFIDFLVFVLALLHMPSRKTVLDLAVRARVLFEHHDQDAALGENTRDFGARGGGADYRDYVS